MRALYPGSFDPLTNGHMDLIERAEEEIINVLRRNGTDPQTAIRKSLTQLLYSETQRQPMVMPVVIEG